MHCLIPDVWAQIHRYKNGALESVLLVHVLQRWDRTVAHAGGEANLGCWVLLWNAFLHNWIEGGAWQNIFSAIGSHEICHGAHLILVVETIGLGKSHGGHLHDVLQVLVLHILQIICPVIHKTIFPFAFVTVVDCCLQSCGGDDYHNPTVERLARVQKKRNAKKMKAIATTQYLFSDVCDRFPLTRVRPTVCLQPNFNDLDAAFLPEYLRIFT